ncbi:glycosyltransferase [Pseudomonas sp. CAU 1711]|uniref:glycosyltransferase n=1 Tax=Pseudomonas sp. CAU 1711 TaxID=3140356 RepID=UPI003260FCCE
MKILVYSAVNADTIGSSLGLPDYSYYFVLRDFLPVLQELAEVVVVRDLAEVTGLHEACTSTGDDCVLLAFTPPHKSPTDLPCKVIPVFAWEFYSIPNESWQGDERQNWSAMLARFGMAITHSELIVRSVRAELGVDYPIASMPSPVWDKFAAFRRDRRGIPEKTVIKVADGVIADTCDPALSPYISGQDAIACVVQAIREHESAMRRRQAPQAEVPVCRTESVATITWRYLRQWLKQVSQAVWRAACRPHSVAIEGLELRTSEKAKLEPDNPVEPPHPGTQGLAPKMPVWTPGECRLTLSGVVFTALFNPYDGRKNWADMLTAFCSAFRDTEDATLVFKLGHREYESAMHDMLIWLARMPKFKCRVVLLQGYLDGKEFDSLIQATAFAVNASHGEGQCLPLMEFLSCGKPAVAPRHSAMLDYMDEDVGFVVSSWEDATAWSHDPRLAYRTVRHQIDWDSLRSAYIAAYNCYRQAPQEYRRLSDNAIERMRSHCSQAVTAGRLREFLVMGGAHAAHA